MEATFVVSHDIHYIEVFMEPRNHYHRGSLEYRARVSQISDYKLSHVAFFYTIELSSSTPHSFHSRRLIPIMRSYCLLLVG